MIAIALRFLAGRYHATGWDHHVNEGTVEWPPSPFRVLRALVAASHRLHPPPEPGALDGLLEALAALPVYHLPAASTGHTRHYMPTFGEPTKVFDAFVAIDRQAPGDAGDLIVCWPDAALDGRQEALLDTLLAHVGYLGRAESWVEGRRLAAWDGASNARPAQPGESPSAEALLMAVVPPGEYLAWRQGFLDAQGRVPKRLPPADLRGVLSQDTGQVQKEGWTQAPGTRFVRYALLREPFRVRMRPRRAPAPPRPRVARFAVRTAVRPPLTEAVAIGDRVREALMSWAGRRDLPDALEVFSGRGADGRPLAGQRHAFYLPADDDGDGGIDHLLVWAREGFPESAVEVLHGIRSLWGHGGHSLELALVALGQPEEYGRPVPGEGPGAVPQLGPSRRWVSRTPMVLPRHPRFRGGRATDTPEDQLRAGLTWLGLPDPVAVRPVAGPGGENGRAWRHFRRVRLEGGGSRADETGHGFSLEFAAPVTGPIAVGYAAHQGLGQFVAAPEDPRS